MTTASGILVLTYERGKAISTEQHVGDVLLPPLSNGPMECCVELEIA